MIRLPDDWDEDLYSAQEAKRGQGYPRAVASQQDSGSFFRDGSQKAPQRKMMDVEVEEPSKAAELLKRATEVRKVETSSQVPEAKASVPGATCSEDSALGFLSPIAEKPPKDSTLSIGLFSDASLPSAADKDVRSWASCGGALSCSFRASASSKGLVALPSVRSDGTFRITLVRLSPSLETGKSSSDDKNFRPCIASSSQAGGASLLKAQTEAHFGADKEDGSLDSEARLGPPLLLAPKNTEATSAVLEKYRKLHMMPEGGLGVFAAETFDLLGALCRCTAENTQATWPPGDARALRRATLQLSEWLSRVNAQTAERCIKALNDEGPRALGIVGGGDSQAQSLDTAFLYLGANLVQSAVIELGTSAAGPGGQRFDRLAAIMAACGGATGSGAQRRSWLRRQVMLWRGSSKQESVQEVMNPGVWRLYCLLAGELDEVVGRTSDWRTAFGMYLWYRLPTPDEDCEEVVGAVKDFEKALEQRGGNCPFRPCAKYLDDTCKSKQQPLDLQFNIIRAMIGLLDWEDLGNFECRTHTRKPLDVALSWHFSVLLIALLGGSAGRPRLIRGFEVLTQQYCLMLEMGGHWEWAAYVALFINDPRARSHIIQGIILRGAGAHEASLVASEVDPSLACRLGLPTSWVQHAQALYCETRWDWATATAHRLASEGYERALEDARHVLAPIVLSHAQAPFLQGPTVSVALRPMQAPAVWFQGVLEALEKSCCDERWRSTGAADVLRFLQGWVAEAAQDTGVGGVRREPSDVVRLLMTFGKPTHQHPGVPH